MENTEHTIYLSFLDEDNNEENVPRGTNENDEGVGESGNSHENNSDGQNEEPISNSGSNGFDSSLIIEVFDMAISQLGSIGFAFAGLKVSRSELQLTAKEKSTIRQPLDKVLAKYSAKMSDEMALIVLLVTLYGGKSLVAYANAEKKEVEKEIKNERKETGEIITTDGRPYSKETHFLSGKPKKGK